MKKKMLVLAMGLAGNAAADDIVIDGRMAVDEWQGAQHFDQFVSVAPLTREPVPEKFKVEAWLKSTPAGIAVAVQARHPEDVPKTETRMSRDGRQSVDRANFMIDFDADGRNAYAFTLTQAGDIIDHAIVRENVLQTDWDGEWSYAAHRDGELVTFEWLIPWTTATMQRTEGDLRKVAVYFDRVIAATGQRYAYPGAGMTQPRFVSDFVHIEIPQYRQQLIAVTPYAVASHDLIDASSDGKVGADLFWKPSVSHQFAATVNPDFGQIESDDLVVNFSAIETFFTDKRPFFIDNQSAFDGSMPGASMFYTRRVGGAADDGSGASDINAALKASGSFGQLGYGAFMASEDGEAGRDFALLRGSYGSDTLDVKLTQSFVDRPFFDRDAAVTAVHTRWRPTSEWLFDVAGIRSDVDVGSTSTSDWHGGAFITHDPEGPWRQEFSALHTGDEFDINDLGFQGRNNQNRIAGEFGYRQDGLAADSPFASHDWVLAVAANNNDHGLALGRQIDAWRYSELRDGGSLFVRAGWAMPGHDDRIARGAGVLRTNGGPVAVFERARPRAGHWSYSYSFSAEPNAVDGMTYTVGATPRLHVSDRFDIDVGAYFWQQHAWLLWQGGDVFADYRSNRFDLSSNLNWFIGDRHELRAKLQTIAIDADGHRSYRLAADGHLNAIAAADDFTLRNLGVQLRYRYKLGYQRDLFVVYSRGGFGVEDQETGLGHVFGDVFSLRDDEQFLIKLAYRFQS